MYDTGLPATGTASRTSTPTTTNASATQRVEPAADCNPTSTQTANARLQNVVTADKNLHQPKKCVKAAQRNSNGDKIKGRRQSDEVSTDSSVTRPDRDIPATVSKQRGDIAVDIRMPYQPPPQRLPTTDVRQPNTELGGRLPEQSSHQSSSHIRAEEFLQVSNLSVCHKPTFTC